MNDSRKPIVLLYHRIGTAVSDPWSLSVSLEHFGAHLEAMVRDRTPVSVREMVNHLRSGGAAADLFAVSFDDGYAETAALACPVLSAFDIPATFFVPSGAIDSAREFWWDELAGLLLGERRLPATLSIDEPVRVRFELGSSASVDPSQRHVVWHAWEPPPTGRHALYRALWEACRSLDQEGRTALLDALQSWAGAPPEQRPAFRCLTAAELATFEAELFDIGAHTVTHPCLADLPVEAQRREIRDSKATLEHLIGRPVDLFAYPYGKETDVTLDTVAEVSDAGFSGACLNIAGAIPPDTDPLRLPRVFIDDWNATQFEARLTACSA